MSLNYKTKLQLRIDWADLDLFGHVNNVIFFKYIQAARVDYCESIGLTSLTNSEGNSFMVASSQCQFKKPLLYPGEVIVYVRIGWIKNTSFQLTYQLFDSQGMLVAEGTDVLVAYNHHQKQKIMITDALREKMEQG